MLHPRKVVARLDSFVDGTWKSPMLRAIQPEGSPDECPEAYRELLRMLREIVASGRWPETSAARARVVRAGDGGTFSIGAQQAGQKKSNKRQEFPGLAEAAFALERQVGPRGRSPSTWVTFNQNALFAPHTDSGAGLGQSRSLIVGLGAYTGGELVVEGKVSDVRYQPLEFDGWRQRHWTLPFDGERFTVVFFTPA